MSTEEDFECWHMVHTLLWQLCKLRFMGMVSHISPKTVTSRFHLCHVINLPLTQESDLIILNTIIDF